MDIGLLLEDLSKVREKIRKLTAIKRELLARLKGAPENKVLLAKRDEIDRQLQVANKEWTAHALSDDPQEYNRLVTKLTSTDKLTDADAPIIKQIYAAQLVKAEEDKLHDDDLEIWEDLRGKLSGTVIDKILAGLRKVIPVREDQYKYPTRKLIRKQSLFRSSFGKTRSYGGRGGSVLNKMRKNIQKIQESKFSKKLDMILREL